MDKIGFSIANTNSLIYEVKFTNNIGFSIINVKTLAFQINKVGRKNWIISVLSALRLIYMHPHNLI